MLRTIILLSLIVSISYGISSRLDHHRALNIVQDYTGESYMVGDCESKDIYESDDEAVVKACSELEGI